MIEKIVKYASITQQAFLTNSLLRNAALLMSSTIIMSILGFGFWIFVAHLYTPSEIGVASSLIAISTLISNLSLIGYNSGLIRFLPKSKNQSSDINTAAITVFIVTIIFSSLFLAFGHTFGFNLYFLNSPFNKIVFIILLSTVSLNSLTDAVFIANRKAELHTATYAVLGGVKLVLPLFLVGLGSLGIYSAYILSMFISLLFSIYLMYRSCNYVFLTKPNKTLFKRIRKYAANNYIGTVVGGLPSQILPALIILRLTSADAAYFSMAWMMANLLYIIPSAVTQSLLAESSFNLTRHHYHLKHTIRILVITLIPVIVLSILIAPLILGVFGKQYSAGSTGLFQILALATIFVAINYVGSTVMNIRKKSSGVTLVQIVSAVVTMGLVLLLIDDGLVGVGISVLAGYFAGSITTFGIIFKNRYKQWKQNSLLPPKDVTDRFLTIYGLKEANVGTDLGGKDRSSTMYVTYRNKQHVLKIWNAKKLSYQQTLEEIAFIEYLSANKLPVPHFIESTEKNILSRIVVGKDTWLCVLMKREQGEHPKSYNSVINKKIATLQAKLHKYGIRYGRDTPKARHFLSRSSIKSKLLSRLPMAISHFDYTSNNILVKGTDVTCIIDFEGVRYDPTVMCLYYSLTNLYEAYGNKEYIKEYLDAYQSVRPLSPFELWVLRLALSTHHFAPAFLKLKQKAI